MDFSNSSNYGESPGELFASQVFQQYARRLLDLANARLSQAVRGKVSPEDIVQSAFKSFFRRMGAQKQVPDKQLAGQDVVWSLLSIITIRKCRKWQIYFHSEKRTVSRELTDTPLSQTGSPAAQSPSPGPEDSVVVEELLEKLFQQFEPRQREMILMRIEGLSVKEIAAKCQSSCRTVARTIATAKYFLAEILLEGD